MTDTINKILKGDRIIILIVIILMFMSALLMGSTSASIGIKNHSFSLQELFKQLFLSSFAFLIMIFVSRIPYQIFFRISKYLLIVSLFLLALTLISGESINQTRRWLNIPFLNISVQTSDIVRLALVIHIAKIISEYDANKDDLKEMMKRVLYWTLPILLIIALINISTAILLTIIVFTILFFTPIDKKIFAKIVGIVAVVGILFILSQAQFNFGRGGTSVSRLNGSDAMQKEQCLVAVSNAPLLPHPGASKQKYLLPNSASDFVFAIAIEEYGFIGIILIISMFIIFLYRIVLIVKQQKRSFPMFMVLGLSMNIMFQAFMHFFVNVGIGPITGQPLPLVSMGGTSTVITAVQIGIILNISALNTETKPAETNDDMIENTVFQQDTYDDDNNTDAEIEIEEEIEIEDYPFLVG